ncbi:LacI family DNA-binding transcriptional regulator [Frondihabitans australicus]|uniref:LacI family transcriptional regulator n=1 Tax=Frondihabitans australicus TaxID=386892 RepID=A0A495IH07_9MICO|nr:substrate-binding domain-containing protein [Frondihabitans australicus]RKR75293.1 LacI family transcriptional regulator [Frondihabitans australicus]
MATERPRRRPSMADVGRASGVSAQTVSRYYTGGYVSPATRDLIERAVGELGYQHNKLPSILRAQHTDAIGFLSMGPLNYGNSGILTGISRAARAEGQTLLTTQLDLDPESPSSQREFTRTLESFLSVRVDGIVVGTPYVGLEKLLEAVGRTVPIVSLSEVTYEGIDTVHADSYGAARLAVRHLIELGHRRILHLAGPGNRNESGERVRGYRDELSAAGIAELPIVRCDEWDAVSGASGAERADPSTFTAVFSANDELALGFMSVMRSRGLVAPRDYSIAGVDDMPEARFFAPSLTSARLDFEELGETALRMILGRIHDVEQTPREVIPAVLSVRESTGAPAAATT